MASILRSSLFAAALVSAPILALTIAPCIAHAYRLSPMEAEFSTNGSQIARTFTIENPSRDKIAVELTLKKREMDVEGKELRSDTTNFTVYPEQVALEPGEKRNVQVTWVGPATVGKEEAYRLIADQLPVDLEKPKAKKKKAEVNLKFVLQYVASLYVSSGPVKPRVRIESVKRTVSNKGIPEAEIVLINEGDAHQLLAGSRIFLRAKTASGTAGTATKEVELSRDQVKQLDAENILAGAKRRFLFAIPKELGDKPLDAEIKIAQP